MDDRLTVNRESWDDRAPLHAESANYAVEEFVADPERLSGVVRFDLPRLGDVGGRLFLREGHPVLWSLDETVPDDLCVLFAYFETPEPLVCENDTSYVPTSRPLTATVTHEWNHGLGEVVTALLDRGFTLTGLVEHASVPHDALPGRMTGGDDGEYRLTERPERLPLSYTLQAVGPGCAVSKSITLVRHAPTVPVTRVAPPVDSQL